MNEYSEYLLDRIFELREDYRKGEFDKDYYQNVVGELVICLSQFTTMVSEKFSI